MGSIRLGLERISGLLKDVPLQWRAIHVAGTNGKGSICHYLTAMLQRTGIRSGRFTSPHLVQRWDGITIDGETVNESVFRLVEDRVRARNQSAAIDASDFELLTATAFEIFNQENVQVGVVECGMGGLTDATNILEHPLVTVISNIGLDHQAFLGNTVERIAEQKAGIIKPGRPCVLSGSNPEGVLAATRTVAGQKAATLKLTPDITSSGSSDPTVDILFRSWGIDRAELEVTQQRNMLCAYFAMKEALPALISMPGYSQPPSVPLDQAMAPALRTTTVPGRYHWLHLPSPMGRAEPVLLDGAHNRDAWEGLSRYVDAHCRNNDRVVWVMSVSNGRPAEEMLRLLVRPMDSVVFTEFGPVEGMPWVKPLDAVTLAANVSKSGPAHDAVAEKDVAGALKQAAARAAGGPLVIAGSLYLVSDVMRLLSEAK